MHLVNVWIHFKQTTVLNFCSIMNAGVFKLSFECAHNGCGEYDVSDRREAQDKDLHRLKLDKFKFTTLKKNTLKGGRLLHDFFIYLFTILEELIFAI